ncbi:type I restriction-modification system subunit M [Arthrobacter psychrochitiniphilus]|uniref:site-specific DNA-methyltransferase (adenine-specific) n=1 Tax=Arthrobacter psychrochitiniphilus TaxID=291045 RepID=A0A2V3DP75_9MICC|nr:class I SAM-dependent DNA methyltransferase [Arthrobacter psychrochitiniphilus]NYG16050.1 type I restriction enzyme M protein [Arthrobacter psychrochitiniphilus]PXA64004.1 restriction endonuclease subunit M [Arthrobacter psychrochitiniphilus]
MSDLGPFIWQIADLLRGPYRPNQYGAVILPMTILRRLDAILEPTRDQVRAIIKENVGNERLIKAKVRNATGLTFYNTSDYQFAKPVEGSKMQSLLDDADNLRENLILYLDSFGEVDVFQHFDFAKEVEKLDNSDRLRLIVDKFAQVALHPNKVSNAAMGDAYEYIIRKFAEASNETSGDHYTPRDAIRLMVDLLFAEKNDILTVPGKICDVYDPTAGTGGMLSVAEEHLLAQNPDANIHLFGQEYNEQSYAICKSDLLAKGQDATNIRFGDTLIEDKFADRGFDFCLSNPPYGVDWKAEEREVKAERASMGAGGRFAAGLPSIGDGQMLFLMHMAHKMRPKADGGGRAAIVLNGSPLFNGGAESGPSEIRRWLLENDFVEAIVALPTNMFFNTGIATYIWLLDNSKQPERVGKVQLIDGTSYWTKMGRNLGSKSRNIDDGKRKEIVKLYDAFDSADSAVSKVFNNEDFGYWTITVERPLFDEAGKACTDRKGNPKPDPKKRDTENVPFTFGKKATGQGERDDVLKEFFDIKIAPYLPDAWVNFERTKVGYEIPFGRHFFARVEPRTLDEIDGDLEAQISLMRELLREVEE